jgi:hypothetical protein
MKKLEKKLQKLEEKYVETYKDNKNLLKDRTTFEEFLKLVFPKGLQEEVLTSELGLYDIEHISAIFAHVKE